MNSLKESNKNINNQNHLINEKSPYLIQHAPNPVDWYPWSKKAFEKARRENKPVFLSIGYSTCHWCHVMAHESFQDPEVADLMNQVFVSIKVDREERPDIDSTYMTVCQMMTGSGGWPLTIIMTPDKKPFFAGTYFPKESRSGSIGLKDLILNIRDLWLKNPTEVSDSANQITQALKKMVAIQSGNEVDASIMDDAYQQLSMNFDKHYGGFGDYQKFPYPSNLIFLLRYWRRTQNADALEMVEKTLQSMMQGGIYDHLGFGFHRYAVDQRWLVPHFEKMLYDQALISMAYVEAFQATGEEKYRKITEQIFKYVIRDMQSEEGGFYSAEDADSEGVEGKFYLWTTEEIYQVLDEDEAEFTSKIYHLKDEGNYIEESTGKRSGSNILHLEKFPGDVAEEENVQDIFLESKVEEIRRKLFKIREARVHPNKDDKILADWNGLMIAALSKGSQILSEERYLNAAVKAADFILNNMCQEGRLLHRYREGEAAIMANLDDYAFLIWGLLELYQVTFQVKYLRFAIMFNEILLNHFQDEDEGFYFTPNDGEKVLMRRKDSYDSAVPSGNSVEMLNLLLLARITENPEMEEKSLDLERAFSDRIRRSPTAHTQLLLGLDFKLGPFYEVVIVGNLGDEDTQHMLEKLREHYAPNKVVLFKESENSGEIINIAKSLEFKEAVEGMPTAYVCVNGSCMMPITNVNKLLDLLR